MSIAPVVRTVEVNVAPARAFDLFSRHMGRWWTPGRTPGKNPHVEVVVEPHPGGRWFEVDADGVQTQWGKVLAWEPPGRLLLGWQLNGQFAFDPELITEVEVTFTAEGAGTRVRLEHRNLERFGADAEKIASQLGGGWPGFLDLYAAYAADHQA